MPSEWAEEEWNAQEAGADAAAALPADVAASMRQFVATLTTPETEMEQQLVEATKQWASRHEPAGPGIGAWPDSCGPAGTSNRNPCLAGSSVNNSRSSAPGWNGGSDAAAAANAAGPAPQPQPPTNAGGGGGGSSSSSSGRSSDEGSSAAWRLASWLQRQGWPAQHCASFRSGSGGSGSGGWRFASGHEFVLVYPPGSAPASALRRRAAAGRGSDGMLTSSSASSSDSDGGDCLAAMACDAAPALVVDPEFSTQFAVASPTARYQVVTLLLPRVFVGTYERLQQLVEWVCREMQGSFQQAGGGGLPPWRSLDQVLAKWRVHGDDAGPADRLVPDHMPPPPGPPLAGEGRQGKEQQEPTSPAKAGWQRVAASALMSGPSSAPSACEGAFSAEQQQAMRSLLAQPSFPAAALAAEGQCQQFQQYPQRGCYPEAALTASSSCSSMDAMPTPSPSAALPTAGMPRSLLTRELSELSLSARQAQQAQQGPAAAILSLAQGSAARRG